MSDKMIRTETLTQLGLKALAALQRAGMAIYEVLIDASADVGEWYLQLRHKRI
jgi:hypothetical protein